MTLPQGNKSTVEMQIRNGNNCICKKYNNNGSKEVKFNREIAFYKWFQGIESIPKIEEIDFPNAIWMNYLSGEQLTSWAIKNDHMLEQISRNHGKLISEFIKHEPIKNQRSDAMDLLNKSGANSWCEFAKNVISKVQKYFFMDSNYNIPEILTIIECAKQVIETDGYWGRDTVCKLDWNAGNIIIFNNEIKGYVDFEQSFQGTRLIFLGTIIDHINILNWRFVKDGLSDKFEALPSNNQLLNASAFSLIYKIHGCCNDGKILFFTPNGILNKWKHLNKTIYLK